MAALIQLLRGVAVAVVVSLTACATPARVDPLRLADELARRPIVLLGEVHDNPVQHRVRVEALRRLVERGARPAVAFEQFDRERQGDIDRARREDPAGKALADHVIAAARTAKDGWDWDQYRPFVELALQYDLPIVAANLSRAAALRVARGAASEVFSDDDRAALALDRFEDLRPRHEEVVQAAHCDMLPASALPGLARAQIARDAVLAQAIRPHLGRGVVLLTGNGHARRDIGVPRHLDAAERERAWSIGLLEEGSEERADLFDVAFITAAHPRADPCAPLRRKPG